MAHTQAYLFYGSDHEARDCALQIALEKISPLFLFKMGEEKPLGIAEVREIQRKASVAPGKGIQVFIVRQADRMTREAQEAFLKTLEEPPSGSVFFLVADSGMLPATIISRVTARLFASHDVSGIVADFEKNVQETGGVSHEKANRLRRYLRLKMLESEARINMHSLVEYEEICHE